MATRRRVAILRRGRRVVRVAGGIATSALHGGITEGGAAAASGAWGGGGCNRRRGKGNSRQGGGRRRVSAARAVTLKRLGSGIKGAGGLGELVGKLLRLTLAPLRLGIGLGQGKRRVVGTLSRDVGAALLGCQGKPQFSNLCGIFGKRIVMLAGKAGTGGNGARGRIGGRGGAVAKAAPTAGRAQRRRGKWRVVIGVATRTPAEASEPATSVILDPFAEGASKTMITRCGLKVERRRGGGSTIGGRIGDRRRRLWLTLMERREGHAQGRLRHREGGWGGIGRAAAVKAVNIGSNAMEAPGLIVRNHRPSVRRQRRRRAGQDATGGRSGGLGAKSQKLGRRLGGRSAKDGCIIQWGCNRNVNRVVVTSTAHDNRMVERGVALRSARMSGGGGSR